MKPDVPLVARLEFYSIPEPNSGCHLWIGTTTKSGYGQLWANGSLKRAHRVSWEVHKGPIPDGLFVCHKCDVPSCINPDHLWLGTQAENMSDRDAKGRRNQTRGEAHGKLKLTEADVLAIRASSDTQRELARQFGCSPGHIWQIKQRMKWAHVK